VVRKLKLQDLRKARTEDRVETLEQHARLCSEAEDRCLLAPKEKSVDGAKWR